MSLGLAGAHRTGKSTLARAYSQDTGILFLETAASKVFADMGYDPKVDYDLDTRLEIQKRILDAFDKQYGAAKQFFVTDRTPIDMMAYLLADVQRENVSEAQARKIGDYLIDCASVANAHFTTLVVVQPGIPVREEVGKAPANLAYMEHISTLVMGLVVSELVLATHFYVPRAMTDLAKRVNCLKTVTGRTLERHEMWLRSQMESGSPVVFN